jgi:5-(carboxyamino)imidazole ribonucleotide synthase
MFAIAARRLGYRVHVLAPDDDTPTGQVADREIRAAYEDLDAVSRFARGVSAVTFEFENVPAATAQAAEQHARVRPAGAVLHTTQNRLREKNFLEAAGLPVTPFAAVRSGVELEQAVARLRRPAVLKTASWGYDGRGQLRIDTGTDLQEAWSSLGAEEAVLEAFVDFESELSVVSVRGADGQYIDYGPIRNDHRAHILDVSWAPAGLPAAVEAEARAIARAVLEKLEVVGVLCVEFFLTRDQRLLINELAPRPHNSGHLTIDACTCCQFQQQVRAVCGLPLGSSELLKPVAMANLLGDLWAGGTPNWAAALALPQVSLHLYGKDQARPGRKMGHLSVLADSGPVAAERAQAARAALVAV